MRRLPPWSDLPWLLIGVLLYLAVDLPWSWASERWTRLLRRHSQVSE